MKAVFANAGLPQMDYLVLRDAAATGPDAVAAVEDAPRLPGVREAGQPRLQRGHDQGPRPRRAGAGARAGRRLRPQDDRRGGLRRPRARVQPARQRRAARLGRRRGHPGQRVLRLRGQVHRGQDGLHHPRGRRGAAHASACRSWRSPRSRPSTRAASPAATSSSRTAADRVHPQRDQHDPRHDRHERLPAALGGVGRRRPRRWSRRSCGWGSSATSGSPGSRWRAERRAAALYSALPVRVGCVVRSTQSLSGGIVAEVPERVGVARVALAVTVNSTVPSGGLHGLEARPSRGPVLARYCSAASLAAGTLSDWAYSVLRLFGGVGRVVVGRLIGGEDRHAVQDDDRDDAEDDGDPDRPRG